MSLTIWKFPLELVGEQTIEAPILRVLTVQVQKGVGTCLWAVADPLSPPTKLRVWIIGTGHHPSSYEVLRAATYQGSIQLAEGALVFHVFTAMPERERE